MNDESLIWESYKKSVFSEAPVDEISTMGDWNDPQKPQKRKYDAPSIKILTKDSYLQKLKTQFAKNVPYNFNLFFLKSKNAAEHVEHGIVSETELRSFITDIDVDPIIKASNDDNITIIFTNNVGAERVPLTPWMIGHRIGHVIYRSQFQDKNIANEWAYFLREYKILMKQCYNVQDALSQPVSKQTKKVFNNLGTFRSARENKIDRPYEFIFEVFSQYLNTGEVKFNDTHDHICSWELGSRFISGIESLLSKSTGKMFLM